MPVLSNLTTSEEINTLTGERTIEFPWPVKRLTITNDGPDNDLLWRFKEGHDWATLKAFETVSFECSVKQLMLDSPGGTNYRVWGLG